MAVSNVDFQQADVEEMALDQRTLDVILCSSGLIYFDNVQALLTKWHSWLRPGGRLAFNTPQASSRLALFKKGELDSNPIAHGLAFDARRCHFQSHSRN